MTMAPVTRFLAPAGFLALCFAAAAIGGLATAPAIPGWYAGLIKPAFNPPNWIFGPVWTLLYALMAIAAWRVWRRGGFAMSGRALTLFFLQLALNLAWSLIFFAGRRIGWALIDIAALWLSLAATAVMFWRRDRIAGAMLAPYLAWVSFAAVLNLAIWRLNG
jgi:benzodiazapine receptor